ncbi:MAG: hypothetical protein M1831_007092 [Alyxoria varia]|nr:MAG: hypothetical protein M1831_007092 [Alyxoria varia]
MSPTLKLLPCTRPHDAPTLTRIFFSGFHQVPHAQGQFYAAAFPETPGVRRFFEHSLAEQMNREPDAVFLKVVDTSAAATAADGDGDGDGEGAGTAPAAVSSRDAKANALREAEAEAAGAAGAGAVVDGMEESIEEEGEDGKVVGFIKWTPPGSAESFWADYGEGQDERLCDAFFGAMGENREKLMGGRRHWYVELMGVSAEYQRQGVGAMLLKPGCDLADRDGVEAYVDASPVAAPLYERYGFEVRNQCTMPEPFDWYVEKFMVRPKKT